MSEPLQAFCWILAVLSVVALLWGFVMLIVRDGGKVHD